MRGIFDALRADRRECQAVVDKHVFNLLLTPQDRIRDRVLALDRYVPALRPAGRHRAALAIAAVVRADWLLDTAVDEGINAQVLAAYAQLTAALDELSAAFGVK